MRISDWSSDVCSSDLIVHGFVPRTSAGVQIIDTWDTLGMRATQSQDTVLDKAFVPDDLVALVCPVGFAGAGAFHVSIRSEERRVGKECVSTCRSRWSAEH